MNVKLAFVVLPVTDVYGAKAFYTGLGWGEVAEIVGGELIINKDQPTEIFRVAGLDKAEENEISFVEKQEFV